VQIVGLEFFTVNIRNRNTRAAYARAAAAFLRWCEGQGIGELGRVQPVHVAAYIEQLQGKRSAPTVKQHLACIRMLFDWLVTGQVMPSNPAHSVRGPRHSVSKGSTPVLSSEEATALLTGMDVSTVVGLRDRAIIAVMTYTFARVGAVVALSIRLREKNGKLNEMPCHHKLEEYLDAYIKAAGIADDRKDPLFRAAIGKTKKLDGKTWPLVVTHNVLIECEELTGLNLIAGEVNLLRPSAKLVRALLYVVLLRAGAKYNRVSACIGGRGRKGGVGFSVLNLDRGVGDDRSGGVPHCSGILFSQFDS
jgi:Phage integrase, N-terminal SAM-like domain